MERKGRARRSFLIELAQGAALAATAGLVWGYLLGQQAKAAPQALRPPGGRRERDFAGLCIKCGQCVRACPYGTLRLAAAGEPVPIGTPYFLAREVPCYMCPDIPCQAACPTGALDPALERIEQARMGLAVVDTEHCLSWQGLRCEICHRECPLRGEAISVENYPRRLSKHALFVPVVHSDRCTGCGLCEKACPTEEPSIRIVPPQLVQGKMGEHYRLGWKQRSPITQEFQPAESSGQALPRAGGLDYLNEAEP